MLRDAKPCRIDRERPKKNEIWWYMVTPGTQEMMPEPKRFALLSGLDRVRVWYRANFIYLN